MNNHFAICAYCGQCPPKLTRDHVVPRALWGDSDLPAHVATVPACLDCQQRWDRQADYFRNSIIAMIDSGSHPVANQVLEGTLIRSLRRNPKAVAAFFRNPRMLPRITSGGLFTGYGLAFQLDMDRFVTVPEKIVRGLFYYKWQMPLSERHFVEVFPGNEFWSDEGFQNLLANMSPSAGFGDDVFQVRYTQDEHDLHCTAWLLLFYQTLGFFAWTEPSAEVTQS